jgi:hypothetical protein
MASMNASLLLASEGQTRENLVKDVKAGKIRLLKSSLTKKNASQLSNILGKNYEEYLTDGKADNFSEEDVKKSFGPDFAKYSELWSRVKADTEAINKLCHRHNSGFLHHQYRHSEATNPAKA